MRIGLTLSVLLLVLLILALMRWGWHRRSMRQKGFTSGDSAVSSAGFRAGEQGPDEQDWGPADSVMTVRAKYIGTARTQDLFERIVAGGGPAQVQLRVGRTAVAVVKPGKTQIPLTGASVITVGTAPGILQKSYHRHGLLMITWRWNDQEVVSGFWIADSVTQQNVLTAIKHATQVPSGSQGGNR